ncbi:sensor histidine kinase [Natronospirillum operosum]|nr:histidine kinase [Natronospirillum operosum]
MHSGSCNQVDVMRWGRTLAITVLLCAAIAVVTQMLNDNGYLVNLWVSQGYGISIVLSIMLITTLRPDWPDLVVNLLGLVSGVVLGMLNLMLMLYFMGKLSDFVAQPDAILSNVGVGLFFGCLGLLFFYSLYRLQLLRAEVSEQRRLQAERERALTLSQLKVLQSQMEPHFLFNTLANVQAMIGPEPEKAKAMIQALTTMLRANLNRVRSDTTTLGDELTIARSYLEIQSIRMGERLSYELAVPEAMYALPLPPLLLQPLVENAIRHGIEPKREGGHIQVRAATLDAQAGWWQLEVIDTGLGLDALAQTQGEGVGLSNLKQRLQSLYGDSAELTMRPGEQGGLHLTLVLPQTLAEQTTGETGNND